MARRTLNRKELRADYDAAERSKEGAQDELEEEVETDDEDDEEEEAAEGASEEGDEVAAEDGDEEAEVEAKPARKRKAPAKPRARTRTPKVVRMKVVWGVFNNSNQRVAVFDYPKRQEAEDLVAKLRSEKKTTFFLQPVKEPMEEKAEKAE